MSFTSSGICLKNGDFYNNACRIFRTLTTAKEYMPTTVNPILIRFGGAHKSSFSMNANELNQAASSILRNPARAGT